jgi:thioredoxin reductase (NADPH)
MYDLIIIGAGPAGLSAAIYAQRYLMKSLVIGELTGGLLTTTHIVENWPGEKSITGMDLMKKVEDHARHFGAEIVNQKVEGVDKIKNGFKITTLDQEYESKSVIFATGTIHRKLGVKGEKEYSGRGVSYCASCDGMFFKDKVVGVVGGGDSAAKEALLLTQYAEKVYIICRGKCIHPEPIHLKRINEKVKEGKIEVVDKTSIKEIKGDDKGLKSVVFDNGQELKLEGLFIEIGLLPQNRLAKDLGVKLNDKGEIITDAQSRTNIKGVFAAGDCTNSPFKQGITGSAQGVTAAFSAYNYVSDI